MEKFSAFTIEIPANVSIGEAHSATSDKRSVSSAGFMPVQIDMPSDLHAFRIKRVFRISLIVKASPRTIQLPADICPQKEDSASGGKIVAQKHITFYRQVAGIKRDLVRIMKFSTWHS